MGSTENAGDEFSFHAEIRILEAMCDETPLITRRWQL